jgi:hypothetical protein
MLASLYKRKLDPEPAAPWPDQGIGIVKGLGALARFRPDF